LNALGKNAVKQLFTKSARKGSNTMRDVSLFDNLSMLGRLTEAAVRGPFGFVLSQV
jgi:hypothetical protein